MRFRSLSWIALALCSCDADGDRRADGDAGLLIDGGAGAEDAGDDGPCGECPWDSSFPCSCSAPSCDDGTLCGGFDPEDPVGLCLRPCTADAQCATDFGCDAEPRCVFVDEEEDHFCAYVCESGSDCPDGQRCDGSAGVGICYPGP